MMTRHSARLLFVTLMASYAACEGVQSIAAEPVSKGPAAVTGANGSTDLRQRAKLLRPAEHGVGRFVAADVRFPDLDGKQRSLAEFRNRKLTVVAMTSTSCPLSKKYRPTLVDLAKNYSAKDVQFITVNCFATDAWTLCSRRRSHLVKRRFTVQQMPTSTWRACGALTTTDVIVLDQARTVVYHGAIDDQYGIGYALDAPRHTFLAAAIDSLLAGEAEIAATGARVVCWIMTLPAPWLSI